MALVVVTPAEPFFTLDEAKAHLRVDFAEDDVLIGAMVAAACASLDGPISWTQRCIAPQEWEWRPPQGAIACSGDRLVLPLQPVISVEAVTVAGEPVPYEVHDIGALTPATVTAPDWPSGQRAVRFTAGYEHVPPPLWAAALLILGDLYENREAATSEIKPSATVAALIAPYRIWRADF